MTGMGVIVGGEWMVRSETKGAGVKLLTFRLVGVEGVLISGGCVILGITRVKGIEIGEISIGGDSKAVGIAAVEVDHGRHHTTCIYCS